MMTVGKEIRSDGKIVVLNEAFVVPNGGVVETDVNVLGVDLKFRLHFKPIGGWVGKATYSVKIENNVAYFDFENWVSVALKEAADFATISTASGPRSLSFLIATQRVGFTNMVVFQVMRGE